MQLGKTQASYNVISLGKFPPLFSKTCDMIPDRAQFFGAIHAPGSAAIRLAMDSNANEQHVHVQNSVRTWKPFDNKN